MSVIANAKQPREERKLVEAFLRTRSEALFRRIYRAQAPRMLLLARRLVGHSSVSADDVVQEAWVRAVTALPGFEWRSSLPTWLGGIVVNVAREQRRSAARLVEPRRTDDEIELSDPLVRIEVAQALARLPAGYRAALTLHDIAGFTHEEIAAMFGIETGTSKSQLARARDRIRSILKPGNKD